MAAFWLPLSAPVDSAFRLHATHFFVTCEHFLVAGATSHFFVTIAKTKKLVDGRTDAELPWVRAEDPLRPPEYAASLALSLISTCARTPRLTCPRRTRRRRGTIRNECDAARDAHATWNRSCHWHVRTRPLVTKVVRLYRLSARLPSMSAAVGCA